MTSCKRETLMALHCIYGSAVNSNILTTIKGNLGKKKKTHYSYSIGLLVGKITNVKLDDRHIRNKGRVFLSICRYFVNNRTFIHLSFIYNIRSCIL